jgi:hypothetical protein
MAYLLERSALQTNLGTAKNSLFGQPKSVCDPQREKRWRLSRFQTVFPDYFFSLHPLAKTVLITFDAPATNTAP